MRTIVVLFLSFLINPVSAYSTTCSSLCANAQKALKAGSASLRSIEADQTLKLIRDGDALFLDFEVQNIPSIAKLIGEGQAQDPQMIVAILTEHKKTFPDKPIPVQKIVPEQVRAVLGTCQVGQHCYEAAFRFHRPGYVWLNDHVPYIKKNYVKLKRGEKFRWGDLVVIFGMGFSRMTPITKHAFIYLGGDEIYERANSSESVQNMFSTMDSTMAYYRLMSRMPGTEMMAFEVFRYDPEHANPSANPIGDADAIIPLFPNESFSRSDARRFIPPEETAPTAVVDQPSRNAPCSCGSGKKYKKCHGAQ